MFQPATRETDLLKPENMIEAVHAVVISGGEEAEAVLRFQRIPQPSPKR